jgi:hypothetical protein
MKIKSIRKEYKFIPEFMGNKDLPEDEQISVNIKSFPTNGEAKSYKGFKISDGGGIELTYPNDAVMLVRHIGTIKNIELDGYDVVTNGSSLSKSKCLELGELISELREYLTETAEVIDEKE